MSEASIVGAQGGEVVLPGPVQVRIVEDGSGTAHRLAVAVLNVPPGTDGPPPHWHQQHDETFYVVAGTARFTVGADQREAPAGTFVSVPIGAEHTFANAGDEPAIILNTFTPDFYVDYFRDLSTLAASGEMSSEAILAVMSRYATYPAGMPAPDEPGRSDDPIVNGLYADDPELTIDQQGEGRPLLLLHGGGGPPSMGVLASALSESFEVIAPVHPGFAGTPRPEWYTGIDDIALSYLQLLEQRNLHDVLVVGSSVGGWIASEMAVREHERITGTVLLDAVGIDVDGIELADFFSLTPQQLIAYSFHDPAAAPDPTQLPQAARDIQAANAATLAVYAREPYMHDPKLRRRLALVPTPVTAIWGESDQIAPESYGRAFAASFPNGRFELIREAGHLPHLEQPDQVLAAIHRFADETTRSATA